MGLPAWPVLVTWGGQLVGIAAGAPRAGRPHRPPRPRLGRAGDGLRGGSPARGGEPRQARPARRAALPQRRRLPVPARFPRFDGRPRSAGPARAPGRRPRGGVLPGGPGAGAPAPTSASPGRPAGMAPARAEAGRALLGVLPRCCCSPRRGSTSPGNPWRGALRPRRRRLAVLVADARTTCATASSPGSSTTRTSTAMDATTGLRPGGHGGGRPALPAGRGSASTGAGRRDAGRRQRRARARRELQRPACGSPASSLADGPDPAHPRHHGRHRLRVAALRGIRRRYRDDGVRGAHRACRCATSRRRSPRRTRWSSPTSRPSPPPSEPSRPTVTARSPSTPTSTEMYRREEVYRAFGFDQFVHDSTMAEHTRLERSPYLSDSTAYDEVLAREAASPEPLLAHVVTMQNHMPWADWYDDPVPVAGPDDPDVRVGGRHLPAGPELFRRGTRRLPRRAAALPRADGRALLRRPPARPLRRRAPLRPRPHALRDAVLRLGQPRATSRGPSRSRVRGTCSPCSTTSSASRCRPTYALLERLRRHLPAVTRRLPRDRRRAPRSPTRPRCPLACRRLLDDLRLVQYDFSLGHRYALDALWPQD